MRRWAVSCVALTLAGLSVPVGSVTADTQEQPLTPEATAKLSRATDPARPHHQDSIIVKTSTEAASVEAARRIADRWYEVPRGRVDLT